VRKESWSLLLELGTEPAVDAEAVFQVVRGVDVVDDEVEVPDVEETRGRNGFR